MNGCRFELALSLVLILQGVLSSQTTPPHEPVATTVCEIIHDPAAFAGRIVKVRATVVGGLESSTIVDANDKSCGGPWFQYALKEGEPSRDSRDGELQRRHRVFLKEDQKMKHFTEAVGAFVPPRGQGVGGGWRYNVTATMTGRVDDAGANGPGFGHLGGSRVRFLLISVEDVSAEGRVVIAAPSADGFAPTIEGRFGTCTAEDYAIYSVVLTDLFGKQGTDKIVLLDQTSTGYPPGMAATTEFRSKSQELLKDFSKEAIADFDARNNVHAKIESDKIKTSFDIVLLSADVATKLVGPQAGWESLRETYQARRIALISRPGIDSDRSHALVYIGTSCGSLCGGGELILLAKENGEWKISNKGDIWLS